MPQRKGWPSKGFYSKAHWRYYFATRPKSVARKLARNTPGGKGTRYRNLPARRPGLHVKINAAGTGFRLKAGAKRKGGRRRGR